MTDVKELGKTSTGLQANAAGLLCYLFGWVTGLIFLLIEKENKFVRFHAMQSLVLFGGIFVANIVLMFIPVIGPLVSILLSLLAFVLWIVLMVKAYQGECYKAPIAGNIAEKKTKGLLTH